MRSHFISTVDLVSEFAQLEETVRFRSMDKVGSIPTQWAILISLKRYQVAYTVWGRVVQVQILVGRPNS